MNTVLFDLDGTLLPMDQDLFVKIYFQTLGNALESSGFSPEPYLKALWGGIRAMAAQGGAHTNETAFWNFFTKTFGSDTAARLLPVLEEYYTNDFVATKKATAPNSLAKECVDCLRKKGYTTALATNPVFPRIATYQRIRWAGLSPDDFALVTTYETDRFVKPDPRFFADTAARLDKQPADCLMVGNDTTEDMAAVHTGMSIFFVTDCLINSSDTDLSSVPCGSMEDLYKFIDQLPDLI